MENGALITILTGTENIEELKDEKLPLVLFCDGEEPGYETISEGYNLDVGNLIKSRLEEWQSE